MREPVRGAGWLRVLSVVDALFAVLAVWGGISLIVGAPAPPISTISAIPGNTQL